MYFPASYRTQKVLTEMGLIVPANVRMVDPIGYEEMLCLMVNSRGLITDSGTVVEETCVLQIPSLQMRKSTERPQVYDVGSSVKFDPAKPEDFPASVVFEKLESLFGKRWSIRSVMGTRLSELQKISAAVLLRMISRATSQSTITFRLRAPTVTMVCK